MRKANRCLFTRSRNDKKLIVVLYVNDSCAEIFMKEIEPEFEKEFCFYLCLEKQTERCKRLYKNDLIVQNVHQS